jgi:hypothetical protein
MEEARLLLAAARRDVRHHWNELDVLDHAARRFLYVARREIILDHVARGLGGRRSADLGIDEGNEAIAALRRLRDESAALTIEYRALWLRTNKRPSVGAVLLQMKRQTTSLDDLLARAIDGTLRVEASRVSYPPPSLSGGDGARQAGE